MALASDVLIYIERLKLKLGAKSDEELGEKVGLSKQAIANWRTRQRVPLKFQQRMLDEHGVRYSEWSLQFPYGTGDAIYAVSLYIYDKLCEGLPRPLSATTRRTLGQMFPSIIQTVAARMKGIGTDGESVDTLIALFVTFVDAGNFTELEQFRAELEPS